MKNMKRYVLILLAIAIPFMLLAGCGANDEKPAELEGDPTFGASENEGNPDASFSGGGSYSEGIDENGFFIGVRAMDFVEGLDFQAMEIPNDVHSVTQDDVQFEIDQILDGIEGASLREEIMDREVEDGDLVNIDYVGSIDGVEFDGGSTFGEGTYVTIGVTSFIDDFLDQLIGHMPGDIVNVEVTFPEDYHAEELQGADALFITTINFIGGELRDLSDDFIAANLFEEFGWTTVREMNENIETGLRRNYLQQFIYQTISTDVVVLSVPEPLIAYQERNLVNFYQEYADMYGMALEEFLQEFMGVSTMGEFIEDARADIEVEAKFNLVLQAIAEDASISVTEADLEEYIGEEYYMYAEQYGLPYLKQFALTQKVMNFIIDNAVLL